MDDSSDADKAKFQTALQDRLDTVLTLFEVVHEDVDCALGFIALTSAPYLEPGAVFIPLLEEFVELLLVSTWYELFTYVETRAPRFTKNMPSSKGKALPLLRTMNAFLRFLSHTPEDLTLRGRVQLFTSKVISVADKSAINLSGDYSQVVTVWEEPEAEGEGQAEAEADGDVQMEDQASEEKPTPQPDFYSSLWSLQQFFAHPPSLHGPAVGEPAQTPFQVFRAKSDFVLVRLFEQTAKERVLLGKNAVLKRKHDDGFEMCPRYLTARSLLEHEISDPSFRRQILLQYFILFQFLLNLTPASATKQQFTGGMPKEFVIDGENQTWIKMTVSRVREELCRMQPGGKEFEATVVQLMNRERRYVSGWCFSNNRHNGRTTAVPNQSGSCLSRTRATHSLRHRSGSATAGRRRSGRISWERRRCPGCGRMGTRTWATFSTTQSSGRPCSSWRRSSRGSKQRRRMNAPLGVSRRRSCWR